MMALASLIACDLRLRSPRSRHAAARRARSRAPASMSAIRRCGLASSAALATSVCRYWLARLRAFMSGLRVQGGELLGEEVAAGLERGQQHVQGGELGAVARLGLAHAEVERVALAGQRLAALVQALAAAVEQAVGIDQAVDHPAEPADQAVAGGEQPRGRVGCGGQALVELGLVELERAVLVDLDAERLEVGDVVAEDVAQVAGGVADHGVAIERGRRPG